MRFNESLQICFQFFCKGSCRIKWLYSWKRIQSNSKCLVKIWYSFFRFCIWSNCKLEMTLRFIYIIYIYFFLLTFNGLFQKAFKQVRVEQIEVPGLLKNRMWEFQGSIKSKWNFEGWFRKYYVEFPWLGLGSRFLTWNSNGCNTIF